jgi:hypothetical protein
MSTCLVIGLILKSYTKGFPLYNVLKSALTSMGNCVDMFPQNGIFSGLRTGALIIR